MGQIIQSKFLCKTTMSVGNGGRGIIPSQWKPRFVEGKWYEGEYETWDWEDGYKCNSGWSRYWVVDESGEKKEVSRAYMNIIFQLDIDEIRDQKIEQILKK